MTIKEKIILNLRENVYCRIGVSTIHGIGVIAIREIPKGINPFIGVHSARYTKIDECDLNDIPQEVKDMVKDFFVFEKGKYQIPNFGLNGLDISYYMNHSNKPNITSDEKGINFIANKNILPGEELTIDYNKSYGEGNNPYDK